MNLRDYQIEMLRKIRNKMPFKSRCESDAASSITMACHNIGAGGVSVFCSTNEHVGSIKRMYQRNARLFRANGYELPPVSMVAKHGTK